MEIAQAVESVALPMFDRLLATRFHKEIESAVNDILGNVAPVIRKDLIEKIREVVTVSVRKELDRLHNLK